MNKIAKASIAGAAGVILLMGGAGSLAYWNNSQSLGSNTTVTAGTLSSTAGTGTWTNSFNNATATSGVPTLLVPGDKLTFTQTFTVNATGDHLLFKVAANGGALDTTNKLAAHLTASTVSSVQTSSGTVLSPNANGSYTVAQGVSKIVVTQTFDWTFGTAAPSSNTTGDNDAQGISYTLPSTGVVTLTQSAS